MQTTTNNEQAERAVKVVESLLKEYPYVVYGGSLTEHDKERIAGEFLAIEGFFFAKSALAAICAAADGYVESEVIDGRLQVTVIRKNASDEFYGDADDIFQQVCLNYGRAYDTQDSFWR